MLFNTFDFLLFFTAVLAVQFVLPHRARNLFLLAASYFFYGYWDWRFLGLIALSTLIDFYAGLVLRDAEGRRRRFILLVSVAFNLGVLAYFKYADFFLDSLEELLLGFGLEASLPTLRLILPVGISFYTFQTMSYTIDVYRGKLEPVESLRDFALYVSFFPQLVAGPIERASHLLPQLSRKHLPTMEQLRVGGWLILWGLFKKSVIADNMSPIVDSAFDNYTTLTGPEALIAIYAFAFQIYGDFSGYTDIARGVAKLMGYELMLNFRLPYFATSPQDFWRRWHISLSTWLRDYLYIPLGGNRHGSLATYRNLLLTMLLGGLWHGAAWTFVWWGAYHGALLCADRFLSRRGVTNALFGWLPGRVRWTLSVLCMFHLTCFGWLLFRAESMAQVEGFMRAIASIPQASPLALEWLWALVLLTAPLLFVQIFQGRSGDTNAPLKFSLPLRSGLYALILIMLISLGAFGARSFIYFQF